MDCLSRLSSSICPGRCRGGFITQFYFFSIIFRSICTCLEPLPWLYIIMRTLIENWISKGRMLVDDVAEKRLELCPYHFAISTGCRCSTPLHMALSSPPEPHTLIPLTTYLELFLFLNKRTNVSIKIIITMVLIVMI